MPSYEYANLSDEQWPDGRPLASLPPKIAFRRSQNSPAGAILFLAQPPQRRLSVDLPSLPRRLPAEASVERPVHGQ
jgi:hypothetical protein